MRKVAVVVGALAMLLGISAYGASPKIGYVDIQRILSESKRGQEAKARIEARGRELDQQFQRLQQEVNALKEEIEKKGSLMDEKVLKEKQREYEQKVRELNNFVSDSRQELQDMERQAVAEIVREIEAIIKEMGKKEGYTLILEKQRSFILYAPEELDLTDEVIKALDAKAAP